MPTIHTMRALSAADIIRVWEVGQGQDALERAITILAAAAPDTPRQALAALSLGRRNARLLVVRRELFGDELALFATCPACGERLECLLDAAALGGDDAAWVETEGEDCAPITEDGFVVRARPPDSRDLAALAACGDVATARALLLRRCVVEARRQGVVVASDELPEVVVERVAARLAEWEPLADVRLELDCPACTHRWQSGLDIGAFLWAEIGAQARRLLREVHALARAYGWREADILALSAVRRRAYLELVS